MNFYDEKGLAKCGLACTLCSDESCPGCKLKGCKDVAGCTVFKCAGEKGLDGCYQCDRFPCEEPMLQNVRVRAFNTYARQFGKPALLERLKDNYENGIIYHRPGGLKGDYDLLSTEDGIMQLIQFGRDNPYHSCPTFETERFFIRLIEEEDAEALFACYGDPKAQRLFNSDNCPPFEFTRENMPALIRGWLNKEYAGGFYIRLSVVDKQIGKPVGTIEIYDRKYHQTERTTGILRVDIAKAYEREAYLRELFDIGAHIFFDVFHTETVSTKAIPEAVERISALGSSGFIPANLENREHYYVKSKMH